ncbi:MAG TPA: hypothetical protein VMP11_19380 [Verrucomicrobiae bacterium]|nr:hypothetical protein [Verrucomicrobiae bacterium]
MSSNHKHAVWDLVIPSKRATEIDDPMIWLMSSFWIGLSLLSVVTLAQAEANPTVVPGAGNTESITTAASSAATRTFGEDTQPRFNLGVELMHERKFAGAAQAFERAVSARTNFPEAYSNWGISLVELGKQAFNVTERLHDFQAAAEKFSKAAEQKPDVKLTYMLWSETLVLIGDLPVDSRTRLACYQGAVEKCRKAAELAPNEWDSYNKWGVILSTKLPDYAVGEEARLGLYRDAASLYSQAAERARFASEIGPAYANWGSVLVQLARISSNQETRVSLLQQALEKFDRSAKAQPNTAGTYAMWGGALIDVGKISHMRRDLRDAIGKLDTSLDLLPDSPASLYNLARAYALLGEPVLAVQNLKRCFAADASHEYRQSAVRDADLNLLRGDADFDELLGLARSGNTPPFNPRLSDAPQ